MQSVVLPWVASGPGLARANECCRPVLFCRFDLILAGDDVSRKKPDPLIYNLASERLGVPPSACVVVEDSLVGLRAAQVRTAVAEAGSRCTTHAAYHAQRRCTQHLPPWPHLRLPAPLHLCASAPLRLCTWA